MTFIEDEKSEDLVPNFISLRKYLIQLSEKYDIELSESLCKLSLVQNDQSLFESRIIRFLHF